MNSQTAHRLISHYHRVTSSDRIALSRRARLMAVACTTLAIVTPSDAADWPGFRGSNVDGTTAKDAGRLPASLDRLMARSVQPLITVFINARAFGQEDKYAEMFAKELVPLIDKTYRTSASPEARASVGHGFGGYPAWYVTFKNPGLVRKVGTQSAFMFTTSMQQFQPMIATASDLPLDIYLEWGKYDLRNPHENWDMGKTNRELADWLKERGYTFTGGEVHDGTGWSSWRNRTDRLFEALFPLKPGYRR